ncbi:MAG: N-acetyl-alpha-D-glucosaminyl L-malate synthase BshA [Acidobacteria bacterium]|nr:MAG: N-acetyl-alpha-D-glucosaminyl L-malate synthase BshA [Acidobacteriota bacterium]
MKIGITCYPTYGGSGVVATELGKELAVRGHDVHFISYALPIRLTMNDRIYFHEVEVLTYPLFEYPPYDLVLATKMAEVMTRYDLDILHVHYAIPHSISAYLAKMMLSDRVVPFVTTLHGTDITLVGNDRSYLPITRFGIEQSDAVTAVSEYLRRRTIDEFQIRRPVTVVPNFVDCNTYGPAKDKSIRSKFANEDEGILIHISNFRPVKRIEDVIAIFSLVRQKRKARLLMVGDGPDRPKAEWLANTHGVAGEVLFVGKQSDMSQLLSISDILLLPSDLESFGLVALEAMACEVPVIATRVGGVPEVVRHGVDGFLYDVGDVSSMAEGCLAILDNPQLRSDLGQAARDRARRDFCASKIVLQYEDLYRRTIQEALSH